MLGKIAGALIGERIAGRNRGAKGAILGVVAETVIRKVVPTVAAIAILGFAYKKARDFLEEEFGDNEPTYPSEATPSSPSA
ncbi:MAG TPA: hypothetical protein VFT61_01855 [Sphingomicrobium sp.]|jgi:hypothetical protein|nr:hypothetical protein [Sphingomicrobium sp.]